MLVNGERFDARSAHSPILRGRDASKLIGTPAQWTPDKAVLGLGCAAKVGLAP